ncbi:MAG: porphobilinogen synthase [Candidatus Sericytochromatia bacterium]|nr:porphobilinogen synthase [Candidatus Tanganyikabacteria bacterium]
MNLPTPEFRPRRLRRSEAVRRAVRETVLEPRNLILPLFACPGTGIAREVPSMPGVFQQSVDTLLETARQAHAARLGGVILFGLPASKDAVGSGAWDEAGPVQEALRRIKRDLPDLLTIADVCMCEYTDHGHCGILEGGHVVNDPSLDLLAKAAISLADAGADIIAPSDMMDGRVAAIRFALDEAGHEEVPILSYAVKYASAFYGPFRDAAGSTPQTGDRKGYQMDPANVREALKEAAEDLAEGADMLMVKPALAYMDVIRAVKELTDRPLAAYNVSGEYAMVKAAARAGWIDERRIVLELLTGLRRAGADLILTYHALEAAAWLAES